MFVPLLAPSPRSCSLHVYVPSGLNSACIAQRLVIVSDDRPPGIPCAGSGLTSMLNSPDTRPVPCQAPSRFFSKGRRPRRKPDQPNTYPSRNNQQGSREEEEFCLSLHRNLPNVSRTYSLTPVRNQIKRCLRIRDACLSNYRLPTSQASKNRPHSAGRRRSVLPRGGDARVNTGHCCQAAMPDRENAHWPASGWNCGDGIETISQCSPKNFSSNSVEGTGFEPSLNPATPVQNGLRCVGWLDRTRETAPVRADRCAGCGCRSACKRDAAVQYGGN